MLFESSRFWYDEPICRNMATCSGISTCLPTVKLPRFFSRKYNHLNVSLFILVASTEVTSLISTSSLKCLRWSVPFLYSYAVDRLVDDHMRRRLVWLNSTMNMNKKILTLFKIITSATIIYFSSVVRAIDTKL